MELFKTIDLVKTYKEKGKLETRALRGVNLSINKGDFVVLSGPSGSGKTTLLNQLGGLDTPTSGQVFFNDQDISKKKESELSKYRLENIGFVFQAYNLVPVLTAFENIEYILVLKGISSEKRKEMVTEMAGHLGIEDMLHKKPGELSGGQQQRVSVARALIDNPEAVLADEPTANLDSENGESLIELMKNINKEYGTTFVISSHDPMVIGKAEKHIRMKDGHIENE